MFLEPTLEDLPFPLFSLLDDLPDPLPLFVGLELGMTLVDGAED